MFFFFWYFFCDVFFSIFGDGPRGLVFDFINFCSSLMALVKALREMMLSGIFCPLALLKWGLERDVFQYSSGRFKEVQGGFWLGEGGGFGFLRFCVV